MGKQRVFIIHGWEATPYSNWFPWLAKELKNRGFEVVAPQMPNANYPKQAEWLEYLQEIVGQADEQTFLVGHSLGVIAILRYLEALPLKQQVGGAVLVAGFSEFIEFEGSEEISNFFTKPLDYQKVKKSAKQFVVISSDDDPFVPIEGGEIMRDKLGAKLIVMSGCGHLNAGNGFFELPEALEALLIMAKKQ